MVQTPRARMGDSAGRIRYYRCSSVSNFERNLSTRDTFLIRLLPRIIMDCCQTQERPTILFEYSYSEHLFISHPNRDCL